MAAATAYGSLIHIGNLCSCDFVVINAASSSVGFTSIQIANAVGATPIALTRVSAKRKDLLGASAAHVVATLEEERRAT
jgi:NADPH:quinone reductase-like Zn-dependent oxidoreductase